MSKIEEMAEKEVPIRVWDDNITTDWCRQIYCLGANAVLREIENILDITKPYLGNPFASLEERTRGVYDLIKELKGE